LGSLHGLPDPNPILSITDKIFGHRQRQLVGDRLRERGIPSITVFPFIGSHVPIDSKAKVWQEKYSYSPQSTNSLTPCSVDIEKPGGIEQFLEIIDILSSNVKNQTTKNNLQTLSRLHSR
jgi:hypothetical protein